MSFANLIASIAAKKTPPPVLTLDMADAGWRTKPTGFLDASPNDLIEGVTREGKRFVLLAGVVNLTALAFYRPFTDQVISEECWNYNTGEWPDVDPEASIEAIYAGGSNIESGPAKAFPWTDGTNDRELLFWRPTPKGEALQAATDTVTLKFGEGQLHFNATDKVA